MNAEDALTDFVISEKVRSAVFQDLAKNEKSIADLSRRHHMPKELVEREIEDLRKKRLVKKVRGKFSLTKIWTSVLDKMKVLESPVMGKRFPRNLRRPQKMVGRDNRRDKGKQGT